MNTTRASLRSSNRSVSLTLTYTEENSRSGGICCFFSLIKKQDERWILYLNDEVMGYVEVKKGFLIKEFCFVWDREKIDQRRDFVKCCNRMDVTPNRSQHQIKNGDILLT